MWCYLLRIWCYNEDSSVMFKSKSQGSESFMPTLKKLSDEFDWAFSRRTLELEDVSDGGVLLGEFAGISGVAAVAGLAVVVVVSSATVGLLPLTVPLVVFIFFFFSRWAETDASIPAWTFSEE